MGTNGGAAVYNYGTVIIEGGSFTSVGGYALNNQASGNMTVSDAYVKGGIYNCGDLTLNDTEVLQHISGRHAIYNWAAKTVINGGVFDSISGNELILADGQDSSVVINSGVFNKTAKSWLFGAATGKNISFVINDGVFNGYVNLPENTVDTIRPYGDPITVNGGSFNFDPTKWLASDHSYVMSDGRYLVLPEAKLETRAEGFYYNETDTFYITNADGLFAFAAAINAVAPYTASEYDNATVLLMNDIDLGGREWIPIGDDRSQRTEFHGIFDGQGHTISNITITKKTDRDDENKSSYGFFGNLKGTVKNLTVDAVSISGAPKFIGALVGRMNGGLVENCHVTNSYVTCNNWTIGGLVGQFNDGKISGCSVKNTTVEGYGAVGGIVGVALNSGDRVIENCAVENCQIKQNGSFGGDFDNMFGAIVGALYSGTLTINVNGCIAKDNNINSVCGHVESGDTLIVDGAVSATCEKELVDAIKAGKTVVLYNDIVLNSAISISNASFVLDGNGHTVTMSESCTNTYALFDITGGNATFKNIIFDGINGGAVLRTVGVEAVIDNITAKNGNHTQQQGLLRLLGKSTITNSTFENNICSMVITFNYDGANNDPQILDNCVFEGNTCSTTAVVYYVKGAGATINANKFLNNTVNTSGNGATVYMGFTENNVITNNIFDGNHVNLTGTSKRATGGLMIGYKAVITGNSFINNTITAERATGNDVCASVYYTDIDLSGNYWGGHAPVAGDDYSIEYDNYKVIINDYLTTYGE